MSVIQEDVGSFKELMAERILGSSATTPATIGTSTTSQSMTSNADLLVSGDLEVDGTIYSDGVFRMNGSSNVILSGYLCWGGLSTSTRTQIRVSGNFDQFLLAVGSDLGRQVVIGESAHNTADFDHDTPTNPTLFVHSAEDPDTANTQWVSITHDQTDGVIDCGTGTLNLGATGNVNFAGATATATGDVAVNGYVTLEVAGAAVKFATVA